MSKTLILIDKAGHEICGSDGIMLVDARLNVDNLKREVEKRNTRYSKNFPHKIATGYRVWHRTRSDRYAETSKEKIVYL